MVRALDLRCATMETRGCQPWSAISQRGSKSSKHSYNTPTAKQLDGNDSWRMHETCQDLDPLAHFAKSGKSRGLGVGGWSASKGRLGASLWVKQHPLQGASLLFSVLHSHNQSRRGIPILRVAEESLVSGVVNSARFSCRSLLGPSANARRSVLNPTPHSSLP